MAGDELGRIRADLAVMRKAMGLDLSFGKGMLGFGLMLTGASIGAAVVSLLVPGDEIQVAMIGMTLLLGTIWAYIHSRRTAESCPEVSLQVMLSTTMYGVVGIAACGYTMAAVAGPTVGPARTAGLNLASIGLLLTFSVILVRTALMSRERRYCLGLALSALLAGLVLPILDRHDRYPFAQMFMAVGYLTGVAIQRAQLRETVAHHAD